MNRASIGLILALSLGLAAGGCSGDDEDSKDHAWKDQKEVLDKAREVEEVLKDAAGKAKKAAEDSGY